MSSVLVLVMATFATVLGAPQDVQDEGAADRGISGRVTFTSSHEDLDARPDQDLSSPLLVRVRRTGGEGDMIRYEATYIGSVEGTFDVADFLVRRGGGPIEDVPPLVVSIASNLPVGHGTDVFEAPVGIEPIGGGNRRLLIAAIALWVAFPFVRLGVRLLRRTEEPEEAVEAPAPTLADQLRPLVEGAASGTLSVDERARLELLLFRAWRERLELSDADQASVLSVLRRHPESSPLVTALEGWLHAPAPSVDEAEIGALLEPYRSLETVSASSSEGGVP